MAPPDKGPADDIVDWVEGLIPGASEAHAGVDAVVAVRRWISDRHNWVRMGWFAAGLAMIYIGAAWMSMPIVKSEPVRTVVNIVSGTVGATGKVAGKVAGKAAGKAGT